MLKHENVEADCFLSEVLKIHPKMEMKKHASIIHSVRSFKGFSVIEKHITDDIFLHFYICIF